MNKLFFLLSLGFLNLKRWLVGWVGVVVSVRAVMV